MKKKLIICARDVFLEEGISSFSMRKVAAKAGITATAIYRHFKNKNELLHHVLVYGFQKLDKSRKTSIKIENPREALKRQTRIYLNFAMDNPSFYKMMFMSIQDMEEVRGFNEEGEKIIRDSLQIHLDLVERCGFKSEDSKTIALRTWSLLHGMISLYFCSRLKEMSKIEFIEFCLKSSDHQIDLIK